MEIIIGREEGLRRFHCIVDGREFNVGQAGCVPASVSRKHCKIVVNGNNITIENIKPQNITFVDGNQVFSKAISATSKVQLGAEKVTIPLQQILQLATGKPATAAGAGKPAQEAPTFSLRPLKNVWEKYHDEMLQIDKETAEKRKDEKKKNNMRGMLSPLGMLFGFIPGIGWFRFVIIGASLLLALYFFLLDEDDEIDAVKKDELKEKYIKIYKCPNPKCGKPFGYKPYSEIEYNPSCPACKCKYTH